MSVNAVAILKSGVSANQVDKKKDPSKSPTSVGLQDIGLLIHMSGFTIEKINHPPFHFTEWTFLPKQFYLCLVYPLLHRGKKKKKAQKSIVLRGHSLVIV